MKKRRKPFFSEAALGLLSLFLLWYIICGDPTRYPAKKWIASVPGGPLASAPFFLGCMLLAFAVEGWRAAERCLRNRTSLVREALDYHIRYWKMAVPLTLLGYAFFSVEKLSRIYCPVFTDTNPWRIALSALALSSRMHEGAWLIACLAVCALFSRLYASARRRVGAAALPLLLAGVAGPAALCFFVMRFGYHGKLFPIAGAAGSAGYCAAFLARLRAEAKGPRMPLWAKKISGSRALAAVTAPLRYLGQNWVSFWIVEFFIAVYYYNVAASVYEAAGSMYLSFLAFLALSLGVVFALNWAYREFVRAWKASKWSVLAVLALLALPFILHFALEAAADYGSASHSTHRQWPYYTLISGMGIMCVIMALRALMGRWHVAGIVATALFILLATANHFTYKYHGTLLTVEDLSNIQTAANVAGGYDFSVDEVTGRVLLYALAGLACCLLAWFAFRKARPAFVKGGRWVTRAVCLVAALGIFFFTYFSKSPLVEEEVMVAWDRIYAKKGYFNGTMVNIRANSSPVIRKPAAFSREHVAELVDKSESQAQVAQAAPSESYPDIIMILNETWYDLDDFMDTNADADYMKYYKALDNAVKGRVVVPLSGGGTNSTEYESLTGNSTSLINAYSPYNRLELTDQVSLVSYLERYGYASFGAHPMDGKNYGRNRRWEQLGFDKMYFIEDFTDLEFYGKRKGSYSRCTDLSAFKNMVRFYGELPEDRPRLGYFITIQNHGGWDSNPPELALVHSSPSGASQSQVDTINEYLSCVSLTDESIAYLQQYYTELYQSTGRRVVVCMFGDHCTSMVRTMKSLSRYTDVDEREIAEKSTPYFIWANYPLDLEALDLAGTEHMDLCCLMPTVLDVAGIPLSYYYRHIVDMREDVKAFTNVGTGYTSSSSDTVFIERDGSYHNIDEGGPVAQSVIDYYCMEYNLTSTGETREPALFWPDGTDPGEASGG